MLKDVGESFEESAQTKIEEEKKKTGIQVDFLFKKTMGLTMFSLDYPATLSRLAAASAGFDCGLHQIPTSPS